MPTWHPRCSKKMMVKSLSAQSYLNVKDGVWEHRDTKHNGVCQFNALHVCLSLVLVHSLLTPVLVHILLFRFQDSMAECTYVRAEEVNSTSGVGWPFFETPQTFWVNWSRWLVFRGRHGPPIDPDLLSSKRLSDREGLTPVQTWWTEVSVFREINPIGDSTEPGSNTHQELKSNSNRYQCGYIEMIIHVDSNET